MAIDTSGFQKFSYIRDNGLNKYLIEEYLLPGLAAQSRLGKGSRGIPLPTPFGKPQEFIKLEDAATLILSWLEDNNHLYAKDKGQLIKLMRKVSYEQFATIASEIYQDRVEDPNKLFTTARQQNLELYREAQKKQTTTPRPKFDPGKAIDDYNNLYTQLLRATNLGSSPALFQKILPLGVPVGNRDLSKQVLAQIIMQNITELRGAAHAYVGDETKAAQAVSRKLGSIIATSYPEQTAYLNLLGDKEISTNLNKFTENVEQQLIHDGIKLEEIDDLKNRALAATGDVVATEYEIYQQIQKAIPFTSDTEKKKFAKSLIQSINSSSSRPLTSNEIVELAATRLDIDSTQIGAIQTELEKSGLNYAIEYRQNELSVIVGTHRLTLGERNLLRRGINPFKTEKSEADLTIEKDRLLKEYEENTGLKFATIAEAAKYEQSLNPPVDSKEAGTHWNGIHTSWTRRFREHEDQLGAYSFLDFDEKNTINRTRFGRWVENTRSRGYELQSKFFDKWVEFDENLPWNKGVKAYYEWYNKLVENFTIKVGKAQIPLFRIVPWIYDRIDEWKKVTTIKAIASTSTWKNPIGKFIHWNLEQYKLGDYTVNGAVFQVFHSAWGSSTKWVLERSAALATKMGVGTAFKYASISASRTATRLLLQIGGRTLARLGEKAVGALVAATTGIGAVFSFALGALMIFDVIKLGWNFIKNFLSSADFRSSVAKVGLTLGAIVLAVPAAFASVLSVVSLLMLSVLQPIFLSLMIIGGIIFFNTMNQSDFAATIHLDSSSSPLNQIIADIICESNTSSSASPAASAAMCIVETLQKCNASPLTNSMLSGGGWKCALAALTNPQVADAIYQSTSHNTYFQCVGFIAATAAWIGKPIPQINACSYVNNAPSGYRYYSGTGNLQVGDFFVIGSSSCSNGSPGHVGIVCGVAGAVITACDANYGVSGGVRSDGQFAKSQITGIMRPN